MDTLYGERERREEDGVDKNGYETSAALSIVKL
jgi:hypothetical protein